MKRKDLDPRFFNGLKWIRGQLAHRGVIVSVDLHQWKPGAKPSWLWRTSSGIDHQTTSNEHWKMNDYDAMFGGKPVVGMLNVVTELAEVSWIFGQQAQLAAATT